MKLKDVEIEFSFTDADNLEKFENAMKKVKDEAQNSKKEKMSLAEAIKRECKIIEMFFDEVFGAGISERIFKGKKDLKEHIELFQDIANEKVKQTQGFQNLYNSIENGIRYMPNRETRRYNQYHKKGRR